MKKTLLVVGAGKGLGNAVARMFAEHDFRVVLMCRNAERLIEYRNALRAQGMDVETQVADAADQKRSCRVSAGSRAAVRRAGRSVL